MPSWCPPRPPVRALLGAGSAPPPTPRCRSQETDSQPSSARRGRRPAVAVSERASPWEQDFQLEEDSVLRQNVQPWSRTRAHAHPGRDGGPAVPVVTSA